VLSGKLYNLFQDIPQCLIDLAAAKGLLKYKENLANMREDLTFEREALAERHALEQRRLRRKMEDEKRRLEDLEDLPIPPEEDLVPPRRSMFKKIKQRDAQGDFEMPAFDQANQVPSEDDQVYPPDNQANQEPPQYDPDDDCVVPPGEDLAPPLRRMFVRANKRLEEEKKAR